MNCAEAAVPQSSPEPKTFTRGTSTDTELFNQIVKWAFPAILCASLIAPTCMSHTHLSTIGKTQRKNLNLTEDQRKIVASLRLQVKQAALYDPDYVSIKYPGGDVPLNRGACADVIVRALRADGLDLQQLVHEDAKKHDYPAIRSCRNLDANIDHRRVRNQSFLFTRFGQRLSNSASDKALDEWLPGDIVTWTLPNGRDHTGMISDEMSARGVPLVIHNMARTVEEDVLRTWTITGHYRYPK